MSSQPTRRIRGPAPPAQSYLHMRPDSSRSRAARRRPVHPDTLPLESRLAERVVSEGLPRRKTATEAMPISRSVRQTRIAISPRFATRTFRMGRVRAGLRGRFAGAGAGAGFRGGSSRSERDQAVLLGGERLALVPERRQARMSGAASPEARSRRRDIRARPPRTGSRISRCTPRRTWPARPRGFSIATVPSGSDVHGSLGAHDRQLRLGPGHVVIPRMCFEDMTSYAPRRPSGR